MIKVSIIVPFYDSERFVTRCIEGLLQQSYPREQYEILMIDNNSTDASAERVRQYPGVRLLFEAKQGAYAARNRGLQEAKGEVIAFTDADCVPSHDWLHQIMMAMGQPGLRIVLGQAEFVGDSMPLSQLAAYEDEKRHYVFNSGMEELYFGQTNNMAVEKKLFDELGPFVERARGGDTIFVRQAVNKYSCEVVRYCPQIRVRHMEMESLSKYYQKCFIYGRSRQGYRHVVRVRWLSYREILHLFLNVIQNRGYSWMESLMLIGLLGFGVASYGLGHSSLVWHEKEPMK
jgi:glycosyltransferase involved in cell wall biosynthesis